MIVNFFYFGGGGGITVCVCVSVCACVCVLLFSLSLFFLFAALKLFTSFVFLVGCSYPPYVGIFVQVSSLGPSFLFGLFVSVDCRLVILYFMDNSHLHMNTYHCMSFCV